jgi:hypothetical protein
LQVAKTWSGPISISIYAPDLEYDFTAKIIQHLVQCQPAVMTKVAIHLIFPSEKPPKRLSKMSNNIDCSTGSAEKLIRTSLATVSNNTDYQEWRISFPYPQNIARNVARKSAKTYYTFVTDMDIVLSKNSAELLKVFLAEKKNNTFDNKKKCAFVIAPYELDWETKFPETKTDLLQLIKNNKARPFHQAIWLPNQHATNFSWYERASAQNESSSLHVSHDAEYELYYEPFFVSPDYAPPYQERFLGYGFTRSSQVLQIGENYLFLTAGS